MGSFLSDIEEVGLTLALLFAPIMYISSENQRVRRSSLLTRAQVNESQVKYIRIKGPKNPPH
jgi:hypothetical protein